MTTIHVNERTKAGKLLLEMAKLFSAERKGVEIIQPKKPNAETEKVFKNTDKGIDLTKTKSHEDLLKKLYS